MSYVAVCESEQTFLDLAKKTLTFYVVNDGTPHHVTVLSFPTLIIHIAIGPNELNNSFSK